MPGRREHDGAGGHAFALEVDGQRVTMLTQVSGLALEHEVVEMRQTGADGTVVTRSMPGRRKAGEVTLTRGLTADRTFEQWARDASLAPAGHAAGPVHIVVLDRQGRPVVTYALTHAWPKRLEITGLGTGTTEAPTERLVLVHESFERV
jgi:phage tail-like protein